MLKKFPGTVKNTSAKFGNITCDLRLTSAAQT